MREHLVLEHRIPRDQAQHETETAFGSSALDTQHPHARGNLFSAMQRELRLEEKIRLEACWPADDPIFLSPSYKHRNDPGEGLDVQHEVGAKKASMHSTCDSGYSTGAYTCDSGQAVRDYTCDSGYSEPSDPTSFFPLYPSSDFHGENLHHPDSGLHQQELAWPCELVSSCNEKDRVQNIQQMITSTKPFRSRFATTSICADELRSDPSDSPQNDSCGQRPSELGLRIHQGESSSDANAANIDHALLLGGAKLSQLESMQSCDTSNDAEKSGNSGQIPCQETMPMPPVCERSLETTEMFQAKLASATPPDRRSDSSPDCTVF